MPLSHPFFVAPPVLRDVAHDGRRARRLLERGAKGIALLSSSAPDSGANLELYFSPSFRSGMNSSHTPEGISSRIGWTRPSHPLKSPMTLTRSALGAHTAKCTPVAAPRWIRCASSFLERAVERSFGKEMEIEIGQDAAVAVGIVELDHVIARVGDAQPVVGQTGPRRARFRRGRAGHGAASAAGPAPVLSRRTFSRADEKIHGLRGRDAACGRRSRGRLAAGCGPSTANGSGFRPPTRSARLTLDRGPAAWGHDLRSRCSAESAYFSIVAVLM